VAGQTLQLAALKPVPHVRATFGLDVAVSSHALPRQTP
jgi:hypothetical protein